MKKIIIIFLFSLMIASLFSIQWTIKIELSGWVDNESVTTEESEVIDEIVVDDSTYEILQYTITTQSNHDLIIKQVETKSSNILNQHEVDTEYSVANDRVYLTFEIIGTLPRDSDIDGIAEQTLSYFSDKMNDLKITYSAKISN